MAMMHSISTPSVWTHGEALTKDQLKRRKKAHPTRDPSQKKGQRRAVDDLIHLHGKIGQLGHKVSTRVSKGINYATSSGRNRRAMDRYSPHPTLSALQTSDLPRSTSQQSAGGATPFSAITPSLSRNSTQVGQRRESVATIASSRRSSLAAYEDDDDFEMATVLTAFAGRQHDRSLYSQLPQQHSQVSARAM